MKKSDVQLMKQALKAVKEATDIQYSEATSDELRKVMLELAEEGAWTEYEGCGYFEGVHINEMSDRFISKVLIRDYEVA